ncbi:hypothetical protein AURDEDRAFT_171427 [Auricularia subglabra TFB-10046 SS5]|nr:hypothetical protein AURDEDRAFT_171427 [Auricularia subglabra TFB-10046 SS5]
MAMPAPRPQMVRVDALAAALAKLDIKADAAELLAAVREQERLLRPPPPPAQFERPPTDRERLKDPVVQAGRKRIMDEAKAAYANGFPELISLHLLTDPRQPAPSGMWLSKEFGTVSTY